MTNKHDNMFTGGEIIQFRISSLKRIDLFKSERNSKVKWHTFIYITCGKGRIEIDFEKYSAFKNKLFFIEKFKYWKLIKAVGMEGIIIQFTDAFYNYIYTGNPRIKSDQSLIGDILPSIKIESRNEKAWGNVISIMQNEYSNLLVNSKEILCLSLKTLILMYRRKAFTKGRLIISDRKKILLFEFRKLVNNKFSEIKRPSEYASRLNVTSNYLNSICKDIYHRTVSEIIQERVILEAKRLLGHTGMSVSEISYKLGFDDNSYFGRYFKKATGTPPEKYRLLNYCS
ncbi:MAG: helix-turn-helix domain-containing protein [Bacteroidota bacterium]